MNKAKIYPQGGIKEMMAIALPMVVSSACDTVMIFTDRLFLSRLNPELMNAAMGGGLTSFMMMSFFLGLIGYSTALVAQYFGAGKKNKSAVVVTQAMVIALVAYPVILLCRPLAFLLFNNSGISSAQMASQTIYFNILLSAVIFSLFRCVFSSFFSGIGKTKIVMKASLFAMFMNVFLNYILIYGKLGLPALGIRGAAYGTILGSISGLAILMWGYFKKENRDEYHIRQSFCFDKETMGKLLRFGYPAGAEMFFNILAFNIMVMIFYSCGPVAATAATIVFNWDMVSFIPLIGVEIGVTSLVGRYMGAQNPQIAERSVLSGIKMGVVYSSIILVLFLGFPEILVNFFKPDQATEIFEQARPLAVFMVRWACLYVLIEAVIVALTGALRGAGDSFWAMALSVGLHWSLVPILYVLLKVFGFSVKVGWIVLIATFFVFSFFIYLRYKSGNWKKIKMVPDENEILANIHDDFHERADL